MLIAGPFDLHMLMFQDFPSMYMDQPSYLHTCQQHRFAFLIVCVFLLAE